jgi:hypothetical protein
MLASKIPQIVKLPKYKSFDYKPIYYDEAKEDLMNRVKKASGELTADENFERGMFKKQWTRGKSTQPNQASNIRLVVIIAILSILAWLLLK